MTNSDILMVLAVGNFGVIVLGVFITNRLLRESVAGLSRRVSRVELILMRAFRIDETED